MTGWRKSQKMADQTACAASKRWLVRRLEHLTDTLNEMQDTVLREEEGKEEEEGEEDLLEAEKLLREYMTNAFDESLIERPRIE